MGDRINVLIIGKGAREHTMAWKLLQSSRIGEVFVAPGNAGTAAIATNRQIEFPIDLNHISWEYYCEWLAEEVEFLKVKLVVVGPELPLAAGIVDFLREKGIAVFGPTRKAAQIEASKVWSHGYMGRHGIPQPRGFALYDLSEARRRVAQLEKGVLKKDGLAAGKGVKPFYSIDEGVEIAQEFLKDGPVLLQEMLFGLEVSAHAFTDGKQVLQMPLSRDYKRLVKGGPNTGGVGCYSPTDWVKPETEALIKRITVESILSLNTEGIDYQGVLYPGVMLAPQPMLLEYNCRFGDPEAQVLLPRLNGDLLEIMAACTEGDDQLQKVPLDWDSRAAICVVLCSEGYPEEYETGFPIFGLEKLPSDILAFHAGTREVDGAVVTDGGRVLSLVALGNDLEEARWKVYSAVKNVYFQGMCYSNEVALV